MATSTTYDADGAGQDDAGQPQRRRVPPVARWSGDHVDDERAERERLRDGEQARHDPGDQRHDERSAGRAEVGEQAWVERPHRPASSAVGMWWVPIRRRNTQ